ncbi:MAG TPA: hypothetical protein VHA74_01060, partial [Candidatus Dojkabacteria bacterium]|nr:hypothetical protein [Candidatus Dojkabacteria bacterium]
KPELLITVISNKDQSDIERLVGQRYFIQFVLRKSGVNFDDTKNPLTPYDIANYNLTEFTRYYFRTVYITKLKATSGSYAYFAIYKPWTNDFDKFYNYFDPYAGQYAGISVDGFVNPIMIPSTQIQNSSGNIQRQPFAIALSTDEKAANVQNILLNSGVIPVNYALLKTNDLSIDNRDNNAIHYIEISAALMVVSLTLGLIFRRKEFDSVKFLFVSALPIFTLISVAKIIGYAVLPYDLFVAYSIFLALNTMFNLSNVNYMTKGLILIFLCLIYFTMISFGQLILLYLMILLVIGLFYEYVYPYYTDLIKKSLTK